MRDASGYLQQRPRLIIHAETNLSCNVSVRVSAQGFFAEKIACCKVADQRGFGSRGFHAFMSTLSPSANISLCSSRRQTDALKWEMYMKKFVEHAIGSSLQKYALAERQFSESGRHRLERLHLRQSDRKLLRYVFGPKMPNEPLLSNPKVRQLLAGCLAAAVADTWGELVAMEPGRFLFLTFIDARWVTGDATIDLDMREAINKVRCQLQRFRVSHISAVDIQAYDNMRAPKPNMGRWLEPHIHSVAYLDDESPLLGMKEFEIEAALSTPYVAPLVHPEFGKLPRTVVAKLIRPTAEDLAYVAAYMIKRPDIKAARYDARGRPFNYTISKPRSLQVVRILEALSNVKFNDMLFSGRQGVPIRAAAKREFAGHLRSRSTGTLDLSPDIMEKFWRRVRKADPKLGDCRPKV